MLNELTAEQQKLMTTTREKYLDYIFSCKNSIDREKAKTGIEWLYKFAGLETPIVIFVDSPLGCQYAVPLLKAYWKVLFKDKVGAQVWDQVRAQVGAQVWAQVRDQVWDQVRDQVWAQVGDQVRAQVGAQVGAQVRAQVWDQVRAQVGDQVGAQVGAQVWAQVGDQVGAQVGAQVWDQVRAQVGAQVGDQVRAQVGDQVGDQVWDQVRAQVGAQVGDQVRAQVGDQVGDQVRAQVGDQFENFSAYRGINDLGWISFYDYFQQIGIAQNNNFQNFKELVSSGVYDMIQLKGFCIVSNLPSKITRDNDNRLHSTDGYAIEFRDGYKLHFVHGRALPDNLFAAIKDKSYTAEQFFKEPNEEVKSAAIGMMQELYGEEYVFRFFEKNLKEIDTYVDKKDKKYLEGTTGGMNVGVYTLFKGVINDEEVAYIRCYCPSTDRMFFLGVNPEHNNAKDAIASLYRVPKKLRNHIKYIQRQGERFSTVFDQKGTDMLRNNQLSKEEISDTTTISGQQYFSLLKFEY